MCSAAVFLRKALAGLTLVGPWAAVVWWVVAVHPLAGPVVLAITEVNGVHLGDLPAVALGGGVTVAFWRRAWWRGRRLHTGSAGLG